MGPLLSLGSQGQEVRAVQDVLNHHIRRLEPLKVDGVFGPKTDARVREFQKVNGLRVDGIVGPKTRALLFQVSLLPLTLLFMPRLQLTLPGNNRQGLQPPRLIPPLRWPGPLPTPAPPINLRLGPGAAAFLPPLGSPANVLQLQVAVPSRLDPVDPAVRSRKAILELIDDLPVNSKFKALLIGQVPNPVPTISPPGTGFDWGLKPLFDPLDPKGFGVKGNAIFTVRVSGGGRPEAPNVVVGAWGDGSVFLDFTARKGQARPKVEANGTVFLGLKGTF